MKKMERFTKQHAFFPDLKTAKKCVTKSGFSRQSGPFCFRHPFFRTVRDFCFFADEKCALSRKFEVINVAGTVFRNAHTAC